MVTVFAILAVSALVVTILSGIGKAPLWVGVTLLCIIEVLRVLPLGH